MLPQKNQKSLLNKSIISSIFRSKLVDKCKTIFKEEISNIDKYVYYEDPLEREQKIKSFTLGSKKD